MRSQVWTQQDDAVALAPYRGEIDYMEAHRRTGIGPKRLRRRAFDLLRSGKPNLAQRKQSAELPFARIEKCEVSR